MNAQKSIDTTEQNDRYNGYKSLDKNRSNRCELQGEIDGQEQIKINEYTWIKIDEYK